jgi:hypothetical protein
MYGWIEGQTWWSQQSFIASFQKRVKIYGHSRLLDFIFVNHPKLEVHLYLLNCSSCLTEDVCRLQYTARSLVSRETIDTCLWKPCWPISTVCGQKYLPRNFKRAYSYHHSTRVYKGEYRSYIFENLTYTPLQCITLTLYKTNVKMIRLWEWDPKPCQSNMHFMYVQLLRMTNTKAAKV